MQKRRKRNPKKKSPPSWWADKIADLIIAILTSLAISWLSRILGL